MIFNCSSTLLSRTLAGSTEDLLLFSAFLQYHGKLGLGFWTIGWKKTSKLKMSH